MMSERKQTAVEGTAGHGRMARAGSVGGIGGRRRPIWRDALSVVIPCVVFVVLWSTSINELLLVNVVTYIVLAQGINITYGYAGYLPFGYVGFFGVGAYGAGLAVLDLHAVGVVAVFLGAVAGALLSLILVPLLRLSGAYFAIATLAASQGVYEIVSNPSLNSVTKGPYGLSLPQIYNPSASYYTLVVILGISLFIIAYLKRSRLGLALRAIRGDRNSAEMAGVPVVRDRTIAWVLAAALAGAVGGAYGWAISIYYPDTVFDLSISIFAIVFALAGGLGTLWGPMLGAAVLYAVYNYIGISQPQYFQLIYGILIVLLVLFLPAGAASLIRWVVDRLKRPRRGPSVDGDSPRKSEAGA